MPDTTVLRLIGTAGGLQAQGRPELTSVFLAFPGRLLPATFVLRGVLATIHVTFTETAFFASHTLHVASAADTPAVEPRLPHGRVASVAAATAGLAFQCDGVFFLSCHVYTPVLGG